MSVSQPTKVIHHGRLYRNSFGLYIEELFYLNSRETLERLGTFPLQCLLFWDWIVVGAVCPNVADVSAH